MKYIKVGDLSFEMPDNNPAVTELLNTLNDLHEAGEIEGLLVSYVAGDRTGTAMLGRATMYPFLLQQVAMVGDAYKDAVFRAMFGAEEEDDDY